MTDAPSPRAIHRLKTWPEFFQPIVIGNMPFVIRLNDRDFRPDDVLELAEFAPAGPGYEPISEDDPGGHFTGRTWRVRVLYIYDERLSPALRPGYVIMGIEDADPAQAAPPAATATSEENPRSCRECYGMGGAEVRGGPGPCERCGREGKPL